MIYNHPIPYRERPWNHKRKGQVGNKFHVSVPPKLRRQSNGRYKNHPSGTAKGGVYFPYELTQIIAKFYGIKNRREWRRLHKYLDDPAIPTMLERAYKDKWISWYDFLGTKPDKYQQHRDFLPVAEAAKWVHEHIGPYLQKGSGKKPDRVWTDFLANYENYYEGEFPLNVPRSPVRHYKDKWKGWAFWHGKTATSRVQVVQNIQPLLVVTNVPGETSNTVNVFIAKSGLEDLKESLIENNQTAHAVFDINSGQFDEIQTLLSEICPLNDDGNRVVLNLYDMIDQISTQLDYTDLSAVSSP